MRVTVAHVATLRNYSAAEPHRLACGEAIRQAGFIPALVRLASLAAEETETAAEAAGTLTSLAQQLTTPTTPASLFSLYQATQVLQEPAAHEHAAPEAAAAAVAAAGTLAKLAHTESHTGKEAGPQARGAMRTEKRQALAAVTCLLKIKGNWTTCALATAALVFYSTLPKYFGPCSSGFSHVQPPSRFLCAPGRGGGWLPGQPSGQQRHQPRRHRHGGRAANSGRAALYACWVKVVLAWPAWWPGS